MNRICNFLSLLLCVLLLTACGGGDVSEVGRSIGVCERFSKREVAAAMDEVEKFFRAEFDGCKLLRLEYDEEKTLKEAQEWSAQCGTEAIVLISDFSVDDSGADGSLSPGETYLNWKWILKKTTVGWKLETWGYG